MLPSMILTALVGLKMVITMEARSMTLVRMNTERGKYAYRSYGRTDAGQIFPARSCADLNATQPFAR